MNWLAVEWTIVTVIGFFYTYRNWGLAAWDHDAAERVGVRPALLVTAFTWVRCHLIMMFMHATFVPLGVAAVLTPIPIGASMWPMTPYGWLFLLVFLAIPHLLILMSYTINRDRERADRLERLWHMQSRRSGM